MEVGAPSDATGEIPHRDATGPTDQFVHKNRLQEFTQRATLPLPMYQTINEGHQHAPQFRSTVVVDGHTFTSSRTFIHKKAAEQDVARIALEGISTVIKHQGVPQIQEDPIFCKSILYEYAVKMSFEKPTYTTYQEGGGPLPMFVSSSIFNGETFTGTPAKNKKEAEQMAARAVIESVLANSNTSTLMCEIIKSKGKLYAAVPKSSFSGLSCYKDVVLRSQMQENANSCIVKGKEPEATLTNVNELPGNSYAADHQLATVTATQSSLPQVRKVEGWVAESKRVGFLKDNLNSGTVGNGSEAYAATQGLPAGVVSSTNNASKGSHVQQDSQENGCIKHTGASMEPGDCPTGALNTCRKRSKQDQGNESKKARTDEQLIKEFPGKVILFCEVPPPQGGETPFVPSFNVTERMIKEFPEVVNEMEEKGLKYTFTAPSKNDSASMRGRGWEDAFGTSDPVEAKKRANGLGMDMEWLADGGVRTTLGPRPLTRVFPGRKGRRMWFNTIVGMHGKEISSAEMADGTEIPGEVVKRCGEIIEEESVQFKWEKGDILVLDNLATLHGRRPSLPPRRVLVATCK